MENQIEIAPLEKICSKCGIPKSLVEFYNDKTVKSGKTAFCKSCYAEKAKRYNQQNKEKVALRNKQYRKENDEKLKLYSKSYYKKNREQISLYGKTWYQKNLSKLAELRRMRIKSDQIFRLKHNLRRRIQHIVSGTVKKSSTTQNLLGCSFEYAKTHLESQFKPGMTWENYGQWHIDHIKPCASFDLSKPEEQAKCFHYTNLQPLWAKDNLSKGCKVLNNPLLESPPTSATPDVQEYSTTEFAPVVQEKEFSF